MVNAGRVAIVPKGQFAFGTQYTRLDMVAYEDGIYVAKKDNISVYPADGEDSEYWMFMMKLSPNTAASDGYVAKGEGNPNKAWATDGEGNPGWREMVTGVKGNAEKEYRHRDVNITPDNIGAVTAKRAIVGQSGSTTTNPWYKFASVCITKSFSDPRISFKVSSAFTGSRYFGILTAHVRTGNPVEFSNGLLVWEYASSNIDTSKFVLAYKSVLDESVDIELWCKIDAEYQHWIFEVIEEGDRETHEELWTMHNASTAGQSAEIPPEYTQIPSTFMVIALGNIGLGSVAYYKGEVLVGTVSGDLARYAVTNSMTLKELFLAIPDDSSWEIYFNSNSSNLSKDMPVQTGGVLHIYKHIGDKRGMIYFFDYRTGNLYTTPVTADADFKWSLIGGSATDSQTIEKLSAQVGLLTECLLEMSTIDDVSVELKEQVMQILDENGTNSSTM